MSNSPELRTERFLLKRLAEKDVSDRYLRWFSDDVVISFITAAKAVQSIQTLRSYVREKSRADNALLLGIFTLATNQHIGNIKFEPIDRTHGWSIVGVLIGDPAWRGKGVFREVFDVSSRFLSKEWRINTIWLGVSKKNRLATQAYARSGFCERPPPPSVVPNPDPLALYMCYQINVTNS